MKSFLRRHPVTALAAGLVLFAAAAVALAPWWIDLGPVRAKIERAASAALAGTLTYERMDLSWFPRPEVVVRSAKVSVPGARGTVSTVRVSPALLPLLRGRVVLTKIAVDGLDLGVTLNAPKDAERSPVPAATDWTQTLRSLGSQKLDVELGRSRVVLSRPAGKNLTFEGIRIEATLRVAEGKADLTLSRLSMESPALVLEANLRADAAGTSIEAAAHGSDLDVMDVREKLLAFLGDDPTVAEIFGIVRGGKLKSFTFASSGKAPGDLGSLERMTIHADVVEAKVRIEEAGLDLADVTGDAVLEGGVLSAENATARVGKSRASGGKVLVGLAPGDGRLRVEAQVKADLSEVPAILARAIDSRTLREELALVESLEGSATGRITIGDRADDLDTTVSVSELRFSASYRRIPWPLRIDGGEFTFDATRVGVNRLSGSLGRSTFSGVNASVRFAREAVLERASGSVVVSLEDFFEGVRTRPDAETLAKSIRHLEGSLQVGLRQVSGPLARLADASFDASGTFKGILFSSSSLPSLSIASGRFTASDHAIRVEDADARTLDAALRVSGAWSDYHKGAGTIEAVADGTLGADAIRWGWDRASLPATFRPAAPIALDGVHLSLPGGAFSLAGDFVVANGPRVALDMTQEGGKTDVRDLRIADGDAVASMGLRLQAEDLDVRFQGSLAASTLAKLFGERPWRSGALEGDLRAHVPLASPGGLTADGALTATSFELPTPAGVVTIERVEVRAAKNRIDVPASALVLDDQRFSATGSAMLGGDAIVLDMDVATGDLPYARVEKVLDRVEDAKKKAPTAAAAAEGKSAPSKPPAPPPLAIGGAIRVSLESFSWGNLVFKPVLADVRFGSDSFEGTVRKAEVCGVSPTGSVRSLPGGTVAVEARASAAGPEVQTPLTCLGLEGIPLTGAYEASVEVTGEGTVSGLPRAVSGPLSFKASKGRVGKAGLLAKILGVLNATDVFAGKNRTRVGEPIPYETFRVEGDVADGAFSIREGALVSPSLTMAATGTIGFLDRSLDLMVLSHPLSTLDKVVQAVPVVRRILGTNFLAVAVKATGTLDDPKIQVSPAKDVGKGLVGILERTVTLPVTVFDPSQQNAK